MAGLYATRSVAAIVLAAMLLPPLARAADPPRIDRISPPSWWTSDIDSSITLLVDGAGLKNATVSVDREDVKIGRVECPNEGGALFVDLTVTAQAKAGPVRLTFEVDGVKIERDWPILPNARHAPRTLGADDVIYLIMPDRFANGDPTNDSAEMTEPMLRRSDVHAYHGGDFAGIRTRLPYLKDLGVTAIWLTPVYKNAPAWFHTQVDGKPRQFADFHGYSPVDFYDTNPRFGTKAEYLALVADAHRLGLKVIQDQILGYTGPQHPWVKSMPAPDWFHGPMHKPSACNFRFDALANPHAREADRRGLTDGWFFGVLPDLNVRDERVKRQMIQQSLWWTETFAADAIRLDTFPMVDRAFWRDWSKAQNALHPEMRGIGEAWVTDAADLSFFQGGRAGWDGIDPGIDTLFDFPLFGAIVDVTMNGAQASVLGKALSRDFLFIHPESLVTFLDNHDTARLATLPKVNPARYRVAAAFLLTARGIPQLTWGDEIGLGGHGDDRRSIPGGWSSDRRDAFTPGGRDGDEEATFQAYRHLLRLRRDLPALRAGKTTELVTNDRACVFLREQNDQKVLVALNFGPSHAKLLLPGDAFPPKVTFERLHGSGQASSQEIEVPGESAVIYLVR